MIIFWDDMLVILIKSHVSERKKLEANDPTHTIIPSLPQGFGKT